MPPCMAGSIGLRVRVWVPLPHFSVHSFQAPQSEGMQSIGSIVGSGVGGDVGCGVGGGHGRVLHTRHSVGGHSWPPCCARTVSLISLDWEPPLQVAEQTVQSSHTCSQSMGQGFVLLQSRSCIGSPHASPLCGSTSTVRIRTCIPGPQSFVHSDQAPQGDITQSCGAGVGGGGQTCVLQTRSSFAGQDVPP